MSEDIKKGLLGIVVDETEVSKVMPEINSLLSRCPHLFLSIWSSKCTPVIPNSSNVSIVSLQDLNPVSISTIVGRFVTLDIK